jgi:hypothetical protein
VAGDNHNGDAPGQRAQPARGHDLLGHEQPVDLAGQRPDAPLELLARLAERQQQRTLGAAQHRLHRVHDLVHEQLASFFDVDLVGAAFQGGEPDDVLPPPAQPLGRPVGHEPEHLDGRADTLLCVGMHQGRAVNDARHGRGGDARQVGDVVHRAHSEASGRGGVRRNLSSCRCLL